MKNNCKMYVGMYECMQCQGDDLELESAVAQGRAVSQ